MLPQFGGRDPIPLPGGLIVTSTIAGNAITPKQDPFGRPEQDPITHP